MPIAWPASWTYVGRPIRAALAERDHMLKVFLGLWQCIPVTSTEIASAPVEVDTRL